MVDSRCLAILRLSSAHPAADGSGDYVEFP